MSNDLQGLINKLPLDQDEIVAMGVSAFLNRQEPDNIDFTSYNNGYQITVKTSEEKAKEMSEYFRENIEPRLSD